MHTFKVKRKADLESYRVNTQRLFSHCAFLLLPLCPVAWWGSSAQLFHIQGSVDCHPTEPCQQFVYLFVACVDTELLGSLFVLVLTMVHHWGPRFDNGPATGYPKLRFACTFGSCRRPRKGLGGSQADRFWCSPQRLASIGRSSNAGSQFYMAFLASHNDLGQHPNVQEVCAVRPPNAP